MSPSEVIIVAGVEYAKYEHTAGNNWSLRPSFPGGWRQIANLQARRELQVSDTTVTIFDMSTGFVEQTTGNGWTRIDAKPVPTNTDFRLMNDSGPKVTFAKPPATLRSSTHPTLACLFGARFIAKDPFVAADWKPTWRGSPPLGMQAVYDYICLVGFRRRGTLRALHVFSHAWQGGPILWNCRDFAGAQLRDIDDTDGRADKDFSVTNLPPPADGDLARILQGEVPRTKDLWDRAWSDAVQAVIWGCQKAKWAAAMIDGAIGQAGLKPTGNPTISYTWDEQHWGESLLDWQRSWNLVPNSATAPGPDRVVKAPLEIVKLRLLQAHQRSYSFALRKAIGSLQQRPGSRVWFAPLGTSTMIDPPNAGNDQAMSVAGDRDKLTWLSNIGMPFGTQLGGPAPLGRGYTYFG